MLSIKTALTSTMATLAPPLPNSPTTSAVHSPRFASFSGGSIRHIRTVPSRDPVANRWYDRPHDGAHARVVRGAAVEEGVRWRMAVGVGSSLMICRITL